jgi:hypothetical protein
VLYYCIVVTVLTPQPRKPHTCDNILYFIIHYILILWYFIHVNINYCRKTKFVEPYTDILVFLTTNDGQHVGRKAFGL